MFKGTVSLVHLLFMKTLEQKEYFMLLSEMGQWPGQIPWPASPASWRGNGYVEPTLTSWTWAMKLRWPELVLAFKLPLRMIFGVLQKGPHCTFIPYLLVMTTRLVIRILETSWSSSNCCNKVVIIFCGRYIYWLLINLIMDIHFWIFFSMN